jgi:hypothetical protein
LIFGNFLPESFSRIVSRATRAHLWVSKMNRSDISVSTPDGTADFESLRLCWDEVVRKIYFVTLLGRPASYGEWKPIYVGTGFDVEIVSMGYSEWPYVGSDVGWHLNLALEDISAVEQLTKRLFANPNLRAGPVTPFSLTEGGFTGFTGQLTFRVGWIKTANWK